MGSPFPGMDPYIEACGLWEDFHDSLINEIRNAIARDLPERYVARVRERSYIDYIGPDLQSRDFQPDISVLESPVTPSRSSSPGSTATLEGAPAAVVMHGLIETVQHEVFLEIRELDPQRRLVTSIEVLSPANKRRGNVGWTQYERKRQVFLEGHAHLVEIDLLRGGGRHPMQEAWPDSPYYVMVLRKERAPECDVWPAHFQNPLPDVPVPLLPPDPDIHLLLQPLVETIYARSRYARDIDYQKPLRPPLKPVEAEWLEQRMRQHAPAAKDE